MWARKAVLAIQTAITGIVSRLTTVENAGYQTASDVSAAIASAIGGITELEYLVVSTLPASGTKGVIYLVPHQHGTRDIYDEYIWVNNAFEKIGSTDVDLSQYLLKTDISAWAKASTKPTYTASEVGALPDTTSIPSKTSDLTNDSGFITGYTETDPTVPSWAKASTKPSYTASEVGALPSTTAIPSKTSDLTNDSGFITGYTETDPTVPAWAKAASKPTYTAAEVGALPDTTAIPSKTSDLTNDSGFITGYTETDPTVPSWAKASTKPTYTAAEVGAQATLTSAQLAAANSGITADDLAVNDASVVCTATKIVPTLANGTARNAYGGVYYYKIGSRVTVHVGVEGLTANTDTTLFTLPTGYHNTDGNYGFVGIGSSMSNYCRMRVDSSGIVRVSSSGSYGSVTASYDVFG